jgi:hypothetical protein
LGVFQAAVRMEGMSTWMGKIKDLTKECKLLKKHPKSMREKFRRRKVELACKTQSAREESQTKRRQFRQ